MGNFNLDNYVEVKDRIAEFYADHPQGSIRTFLIKNEGKEVVFEARVYRNTGEASQGIYTSGFARELEGDGMVNKTSHYENCETSAIGRALANLDYCGSVAGSKAPRPSREEMGKVERQGGPQSVPNSGTPAPNSGPSDPPCPKCGGKMWDNRAKKTNPRAPDFKCRNKDGCDGVIWPPKEGAKPAPAPQPETSYEDAEDVALTAAKAAFDLEDDLDSLPF